MVVINDLHRAPVLKTSSKSGLPIAWITGYATIPQPGIIPIVIITLLTVQSLVLTYYCDCVVRIEMV